MHKEMRQEFQEKLERKSSKFVNDTSRRTPRESIPMSKYWDIDSKNRNKESL